jgi:predicted peptidase
MKRLPLLLLVLLSLAMKSNAQDLTSFVKGIYVNKQDTMQYRVLFPEHFDPKQKYPVLFFLHGGGERGDDNEAQLIHGAKLFLDPEVRKEFPAIVIFPQCSKDSYWSNTNASTDSLGKRHFEFQKGGKPTKAMHALLGLVDDFLAKPYANKKQVYIGGLSMGGMGTYEMLRRKPRKFAAAFAICGGDNLANVNKYKKVPLWIFHGGKDDVVDPKFSKEIADQLKIIGKEVKYTHYPEANHNSWDAAFAEPTLLPWLFSHKK